MFVRGLGLRAARSRKSRRFWSIDGKADLPPEELAAHPQAWIPGPHGDEMGPGSAEPPPKEGAEATDREAFVEVRKRLSVNGFPDDVG
jgi:hypothetical protein